MFKDNKVFSSFATNDAEKAKSFYAETLGLSVSQDNDMGGILTLQFANGSHTIIYPKPDFVPATFTVLNIIVDDIDDAVQQLNDKGVQMEHYDFPDFKTDEKGIMRQGGPLIAWFKDPAGNILSVLQNN